MLPALSCKTKRVISRRRRTINRLQLCLTCKTSSPTAFCSCFIKTTQQGGLINSLALYSVCLLFVHHLQLCLAVMFKIPQTPQRFVLTVLFSRASSRVVKCVYLCSGDKYKMWTAASPCSKQSQANRRPGCHFQFRFAAHLIIWTDQTDLITEECFFCGKGRKSGFKGKVFSPLLNNKCVYFCTLYRYMLIFSLLHKMIFEASNKTLFYLKD